MAVFVDTNVLLGLVLDDRNGKKLIDSFVKKSILVVPDFVIYEACFTLISVYKRPKEEAESLVRKVLRNTKLKVLSGSSPERTIMFFSKYSIKFGDCVILSFMKNGDTILSFDRDFDKVPWIKRVES